MSQETTLSLAIDRTKKPGHYALLKTNNYPIESDLHRAQVVYEGVLESPTSAHELVVIGIIKMYFAQGISLLLFVNKQDIEEKRYQPIMNGY